MVTDRMASCGFKTEPGAFTWECSRTEKGSSIESRRGRARRERSNVKTATLCGGGSPASIKATVPCLHTDWGSSCRLLETSILPCSLVTTLLFCPGHCPQQQDNVHSHPCSLVWACWVSRGQWQRRSVVWPSAGEGEPPVLPSFPEVWNSDEKARAPATTFGYEAIMRRKTQAGKLSTKVGEVQFSNDFVELLRLHNSPTASFQTFTDMRKNKCLSYLSQYYITFSVICRQT